MVAWWRCPQRSHSDDSLRGRFPQPATIQREGTFTKRYDVFVGSITAMDGSRNNRGEATRTGRWKIPEPAFSRKHDQALGFLRGSATFATIEDYRHFIDTLVAGCNNAGVACRFRRTDALTPLPQRAHHDFTEIVAPVSGRAGS